MYEYSRCVFYYETDKMAVVHHANYLHWMEEARIEFLKDIGLPYETFEDGGILCPVIGVKVRYKRAARFGDAFTVRLYMRRYSGMRFSVAYIAVNRQGQELIEAESDHVFVDADFRFVSLAKAYPEAHAKLLACVEQPDNGAGTMP